MLYELKITTVADSTPFMEQLRDKFTWLEQQGYSLEVIDLAPEPGNNLLAELRLENNKNAPAYREEDIIYIFKHQVSEFLADHIVRDWEKKLIWKEINKKSRHISVEDQVLILDKAENFIKRSNSNESLNLLRNYGRKNKITHKIFDYIYYHHVLVLEGFIRFCMQDYQTEIRFAVDLACEELKNEKEYNEFVRLLRYFVDTQTPLIKEVNILIDKRGRFYLWDGNGVTIEEKNINCYINDMIFGELNLDDILVSILITVAPLQIILHNSINSRSETVKVIRNVFAERIRECKGCERCLASKKLDG
ncbi:MAG: putative sporulation protein YtxC [Syntrophomonas sp.]|nr:putative sporulation protein YtxC [Syntrophomonas sp.]